MQRLLGLLIAFTGVCGLLAAAGELLLDGPLRPGAVTGELRGGVAVERGDDRVTVILPAGQAKAVGTVTHCASDRAVGPPLALPLTLVPGAGAGRARITGAVVGGERVTIAWDGGRPFGLTGDGAVEPGPIRVEVDPDGVSWFLDGEARGFAPGTYRGDAPVAVGAEGLAEPRDGIHFDADGGTLLTSTGGVAVRRAPVPLHLEGPAALVCHGELLVETAEGTVSAATFSFGPGPFVLDLEPAPGGWRATITMQGLLEVESPDGG